LQLQRIVKDIASGADDRDPRILRSVKRPAEIWMEWFDRMAEIMRWDGLFPEDSLEKIVIARLRKIGLVKGCHVRFYFSLCSAHTMLMPRLASQVPSCQFSRDGMEITNVQLYLFFPSPAHMAMVKENQWDPVIMCGFHASMEDFLML
jgi:hypothetical protein